MLPIYPALLCLVTETEQMVWRVCGPVAGMMDQAKGSSDEPRIETDADHAEGPAKDEQQQQIRRTVVAFNTRIQQRKKEQELALSEAEKARRSRQNLMLEAMIELRKSLVEVARINLGERFKFGLTADDWRGWPRLLLRLQDALLPVADYPYFQVISHDRKGSAVVEIAFGNPLQPEKFPLNSSSDMERMLLVLRRCMRIYLDLIADIVLEAERRELPEEEPPLPGDKIESKDRPAGAEAEGGQLANDFFDDDLFEADYLESLPSIDGVQPLAELEKK